MAQNMGKTTNYHPRRTTSASLNSKIHMFYLAVPLRLVDHFKYYFHVYKNNQDVSTAKSMNSIVSNDE
jgi:hypothetical protein